MASESSASNIMLDGQVAYVRKVGSMTNHGTIDLANALSAHSYDEGYVGPNSILRGTDLAITEDYTQCETAMRTFMDTDWTEIQGERTVYTNARKISTMLSSGELYIQNLSDSIEFEGTLLEYIQGTGTQYIDTSVIPTENTKFEITLSDVTSGNYWVLSAYNSWGNRGYFLACQSNQYIWYGFSGYAFGDSALLSGKNKITMKYDQIWINNDPPITATGSETMRIQESLHLFGFTNNGNTSRYKLYGFKMWDENNNLQLDLIPVKDKNNIVCLYNNVNKTFLYNQGSSDFIAGPEIDVSL